MTVRQLIKHLLLLPQDAVVNIMTDEGLYKTIGLDDLTATEKEVWIS